MEPIVSLDGTDGPDGTVGEAQGVSGWRPSAAPCWCGWVLLAQLILLLLEVVVALFTTTLQSCLGASPRTQQRLGVHDIQRWRRWHLFMELMVPVDGTDSICSWNRLCLWMEQMELMELWAKLKVSVDGGQVLLPPHGSQGSGGW
eukprot:TRINITY_DN7601_c0_g1_i1.p1 TRINITY_DN7601_c0_g1~~TRINITY_DN7601_c0_g1_i1.p1  ORF type:complete len:145 (-),score=16.42 TRINITY_DN7601_c0_g1_i1:554-988(-)